MPAGNTYESIATQTLGSAAASVSFTSIPGTYTDLVLVGSPKYTSSGDYLKVTYNSDTGSNYSITYVLGNGSSASSGRESSTTSMNVMYMTQTTNFGVLKIDVQNYSNATTYKTALFHSDDASTQTQRVVGLWRSTSAITSITLTCGSNTMTTGSTFSLYGIASA
jgi:hypothetical protein